jgi:hypothetical protein
MADEADRGNDRAQEWLDDQIAASRRTLDPGNPGDCDKCGEHSGRLIFGNCARCRDRYRLP